MWLVVVVNMDIKEKLSYRMHWVRYDTNTVHKDHSNYHPNKEDIRFPLHKANLLIKTWFYRSVRCHTASRERKALANPMAIYQILSIILIIGTSNILGSDYNFST